MNIDTDTKMQSEQKMIGTFDNPNTKMQSEQKMIGTFDNPISPPISPRNLEEKNDVDLAGDLD